MPEKIKIGICPIGWTNDDLPELGKENTFEQCISEMALAGFQGTEIGNKFPRHIPTLQKALSLRNLQIASAWFSSYLTTKPFEETKERFIEHRDFLYNLGSRVIVVSEQGKSIQQLDKPLFLDKPYFTDEEWDRLAEGLNQLGRLAQEKKMKIVYHHHMGTGVQTAEEIDRLMELTDESLVFLLFDTGHLYFSNEDPVSILKKYLSRIKHVHLKDVRDDIKERVESNNWSFLKGVREGVFTVPGDGSYDFSEVFSMLLKANYEGWMLVEAEQDPAKANPFEYALKARSYIEEKLGERFFACHT